MKNFILILSLVAAFNAEAQKEYPPYSELELADITFTISACRGSLLQPIANDSIVWSVWIEPIGRINDSILFSDYYCSPRYSLQERFTKHGISPEFTVIERGSIWIEYATIERGIHHLLAENIFTGDPFAYITILIDSNTATYYNGSSKRVTSLKVDSEFSTWAPFHDNITDGIYLQGLLD